MDLRKLLVLGGTGFVGRAFVDRVVRAVGASDIVVPTRREMHARHIQHLPGVRPVVADVHDDRALAALVSEADAVVNLVAILHGSAAEFGRVHVELPRRLARAMAAAGVRRLVHVSALGVSPDAPSDYLRSKAAGEAALRQAAQDGALALTVLRPSVIFGADDRLTNLFARLQRFAPVLPLAGAEARLQPVWVSDVAEALWRTLQDPATAGQTFECAGPDVMTLAELARTAGRAASCERPVIGLPGWAAQLQARVLQALPGVPLMSSDNLKSLQVPNVAGGKLPGLAALGIRPASLGAMAQTWLSAREGPARLDRYRAMRD